MSNEEMRRIVIASRNPIKTVTRMQIEEIHEKRRAALRDEADALREREDRKLEDDTENDSDNLWLAAIARVYYQYTGKTWEARYGESREESIEANIRALCLHVIALALEGSAQ